MGQSFLQEGMTICGSGMSLKMGDLDPFFKVAGVKKWGMSHHNAVYSWAETGAG